MIGHCYLGTRPIAGVRVQLARALPYLALLVEHPDAVLLAVIREAVREIDDRLVFLALQIHLTLNLQRADPDLEEQPGRKDQNVSRRVHDPLAKYRNDVPT